MLLQAMMFFATGLALVTQDMIMGEVG